MLLCTQQLGRLRANRGIQLMTVYESIVRQHRLRPDPTDVVLARRHQHVGHGSPAVVCHHMITNNNKAMVHRILCPSLGVRHHLGHNEQPTPHIRFLALDKFVCMYVCTKNNNTERNSSDNLPPSYPPDEQHGYLCMYLLVCLQEKPVTARGCTT